MAFDTLVHPELIPHHTTYSNPSILTHQSARVSPFRGSAFWFFTLNDDGHFDGSSWHGGAAVAGDLGILGLTHPCGIGSRCFNWRDSKMHQQFVRPKTERTHLPKQIPDFRFQLQSHLYFHLYSQFWSMNTPVSRWPLPLAQQKA